MKNLYTAKGFLLFLFIGLCIQLQADPPSPFYQGDLDKLKKQARKTDTPYFIYFQLSDCESCDEMNQKTWRDPRLSRYVSQHYLGHQVKVMTPAQGKKILNDYGIFVYPALLVFDANGKLKKHVEGYVDSQAALAIFSGKPICTPLGQPEGDAKTATTPQGKALTTRPVQNGKTITASNSVNIPKKEAIAPVRHIAPKSVVATPNEAVNRNQDHQTPTPNNVRNLTYLRYQHLQQQAENTKQGTSATGKPLVTTRPYTTKVPTKPTARNTNPYSVERTAPVLTPTTRGGNPYSSQSNVKKQVVTTQALPAYTSQPSIRKGKSQTVQPAISFREVVDPRFRAYNPWKSLAPIPGINYSLILDGYTTSDQVLQQIEAIKRYWPNSIWVYQEGEAGIYRVALGNFRSEEQAQQYAALLLRSQQLNPGIQDLYEVINPTVPNPGP